MKIRPAGYAAQFIWIVLLVGCSSAERTEPPDQTSVSDANQEEGGRIRFVAAESWMESIILDPPSLDGWIALPPKHIGKLFTSSQDPGALGLLPPSACSKCHAEIVESFAATAHARTTQLPKRDSFPGSFDPPDNQFSSASGELKFEMAEAQQQFWQNVFTSETEPTATVSIPIAFVFGSGNHGQSYAHWEGDQLCQMHISYYSEFDRWTNSPGAYRDGTADFSRPITSRCLDCHATWFGHKSDSVNRFAQSGYVLGVTCVRCHGPAREHVQYHELQPDDAEAHFIINPATLGRERMQELCAQCHSGGGELKRPAFSYVPGEPLGDYIELDLSEDSAANDDPHSANQLGRLARSVCFQQSEDMSCITCHDPHKHERGNVQLFSSRCLSCHSEEKCGVYGRFGAAIGSRCIECHMPSRRDAEVAAETGSETLLPLLRDHLIGIWPDASVRVERSLEVSKRQQGQHVGDER